MEKLKFGVVNGFTATGRTTSIVGLADELGRRGIKPALLTNESGMNFVDEKHSYALGLTTGMLGSSCLGCQNENLVAELRRLRDQEGADVVLAEMPPVCVCAVDHVYQKLDARRGDEFELLPFVVVIDPEHAESLMPEFEDSEGMSSLNYLFVRQLSGADIIVLSKCDLISAEKARLLSGFLESAFPSTQVLALSLVDDDAYREFADALDEAPVGLKGVWDETDKNRFAQAEKRFTYFNQSFYLESEEGEEIDSLRFFNAYTSKARDLARDCGIEITHMKMLAEEPVKTERDYEEVSVVGMSEPLVVLHPFERSHAAIRVTANVRYMSPDGGFSSKLHGALQDIAQDEGLLLSVFCTEAFNMHDITSRHYQTLNKYDHDNLGGS